MSVTLEDDDDEILGLLPDGRPDPAWAEALGMVPASPGKRSLAFAIDAAIVVILTLPLSLGTLPTMLRLVLVDPVPSIADIVGDPSFVPAVILYAIGQGLLSIFVLVQLLLHGLRGITIGKALVGLRSVNAARFTKPGFWRMTLRALVFWAALSIFPVIGAVPFLLSPLWDGARRGRGWLDRIGGNWLIDVRRGLDPFDLKAMRHARRRALAPAVEVAQALPSLATGTAGAVPSFVPAGRSSSGVIGAKSAVGDLAGPWSPPPVGAPRPASRVERGPQGTAAPRVEQPTAPAAPVITALDTAAPTVSLEFDDGVSIVVTGAGLVGRNPEPGPDEAFIHLLPIEDASRQISKTHAAFGMDDAGFWLVDRGSVNGTSVTSPGGGSRELVPWRRESVVWGSVVEVGGRSFTVRRAPTPASPPGTGSA